jgi:hypothetical protein
VTDFTDASKEAIKWSVRLCKKLKCHLTILYTYRIFKQNNDTVSLKKQSEDEAFRKFCSLEKEVLAGEGISYDFKTEIGFINNRVEDHLKKSKISFLVANQEISNRNKESFDDLVKKLKVPLVIVP